MKFLDFFKIEEDPEKIKKTQELSNKPAKRSYTETGCCSYPELIQENSKLNMKLLPDNTEK